MALSAFWWLITLSLASFLQAQKISLDNVPTVNSSVITNYVKARAEYIASEKELRQGDFP